MSSNHLSDTQICGFNLNADTSNLLKERGIDIFDGSLGKITNLEYSTSSSKLRCHPNLVHPNNFHEYEIAILDLTNQDSVKYTYSDHQKKVINSTSDLHIVCHYPQNVFDPRPFSLMILADKFKSNLKNGFLFVCFCGEPKNVTYHFSDLPKQQYKLYDFSDYIPEAINKMGRKVQISSADKVMHGFLSKYKDTITYNTIFISPRIYKDAAYVPDPSYVPLVLSNSGELVSYYRLFDNSGVFLFPDIEDKGAFLEEFITQIAPTYLPELFPGIVKNSWLDRDEYSLPNHRKLIEEKESLKQKFEQELKDKEKEINENKLKYTFLQHLLTETDDKLVHALITFFKWLGFSNVKDADTIDGRKLKEEDILIETEKGIILIETKGIGGTSKDEECSQVGKIKARRERQRNRFDVIAHYIVNHQRHLPAIQRKNPPFTPHQIDDAEYESRGLITTWQLFNLYFAIENGIISKNEVIIEFDKTGHIDFIPDSWIKIGKPKEYFQNNTVTIIELQQDTIIKKGDRIISFNKGRYEMYEIISLQVDNSNVEEVSSGEVGLKLNGSVPKGAEIYLKTKL